MKSDACDMLQKIERYKKRTIFKPTPLDTQTKKKFFKIPTTSK